VHVVAVRFFSGFERFHFDDRMDAVDFAQHWKDLGFEVFVYHP